MITLYVAGPNFGLPDPSPFVTKAEVLLKMSGLPYRTAPADFRKAPKGKIPYFEQDGRVFGDSTLLRFHLEDTCGVDFDPGLGKAEKAIAWAFEKLVEDHLYWALIHARWTDDDNFRKGPIQFFDAVPGPARPLVAAIVRRGIRRSLHGHGLGRHDKAEIERLASRDLDALADFLADKPWLMGEAPCGADAAVWAMVTGALCPLFETPIRAAAERHANLVAYRDRGLARWFPGFAARAA